MRTCLVLTALLTANVGTAAPRPLTRNTPLVGVFRRPNIRVYEQVAEEFRAQLRAEVRILDVTARPNNAALTQWIADNRPDLLFAVGQTAYDFLRQQPKRAPIICSLVLHRIRPSDHCIDSHVPAQSYIALARALLPSLRRLAILHGKPTASQANSLARQAQRDGLLVTLIAADNDRQAISLLAKLPRQTQALMLLPDLSILSSPVFQFALELQFRRGTALLGASRRQVQLGAAAAIEPVPVVLGRQAATLARRLLARDQTVAQLNRLHNASQAQRVIVSKSTASRLALKTTGLPKNAEVIE
ncbi:MAG: hypothetical protein H6707_03300 [Deltaproteobacteria bacterium]|nr:hypothetical protein [Deltaproteobacteria bacterium]